MKRIIENSELLIFDLDGTLYEDTDHFDYYASLLQNEVPHERQESFQQEYEKMKQGTHLVTIGKAYDVNRDAILTLDPMTLEVTEVHHWDGQLWDLKEVTEAYQGELAFDFENIVAIGDGWWLPFVVATHFGVENTQPFYEKTKEYMISNDFQLTKTPGLKEALLKLKNSKHIVLLTNSDKDDVNRLLTELDLIDIFPEIITSAQKPTNTVDYFEKLLSSYHVKPEQAVSIGDNFINEIAPALKLGMSGIFINSKNLETEHNHLVSIKTLANAFDFR